MIGSLRRHPAPWRRLAAACSLLAYACPVLGIPAAAQGGQVSPAAVVRFHEAGRQSGLTTVPHTAAEKQYLVEMMGGGVALFDCDNDGKLDIVTVNDSTVPAFLGGGEPMVTLYHQDTAAGAKMPHFTDTTGQAGMIARGWGMGVAVADFDNDGLPDLYVTGYGHNVLYRNVGGCRFQDVTAQYGVAGGGFSVGAAWADYDRDGLLDLFVSRYVDTDLNRLPKPGDKNFQYQGLAMEVPTPRGETDLLFHRAGPAFQEAGARAGVGNPEKRLGMGVVWADYDHDGWPDLFVSNDMGPNFLYHNQHDGTFEEVGLLTGTAFGADGRSMGNMAGDFADYDRSGSLDLAVTRYGYQPMSLYRNDGATGFTDQAAGARLDRSAYQLVAWGAGFADFGNTGWPDLLVANGNVSSLVDKLPHDLSYREPLQLFRNSRDGTFAEIAGAAGLNDGPLQSRRGVAFGDINNDGAVDFVVYNVGAPPSLFLNATISANHRVLLCLVGTRSNRSAIGARVTVTSGKLAQIDEVRGGGGYLSSNDLRLHFGLGPEIRIESIRVEWPSGLVETLKNVPADKLYTLKEGSGIAATTDLSTRE